MQHSNRNRRQWESTHPIRRTEVINPGTSAFCMWCVDTQRCLKCLAILELIPCIRSSAVPVCVFPPFLYQFSFFSWVSKTNECAHCYCDAVLLPRCQEKLDTFKLSKEAFWVVIKTGRRYRGWNLFRLLNEINFHLSKKRLFKDGNTPTSLSCKD